MNDLQKAWKRELELYAGDYGYGGTEHELWCAFKAGWMACNRRRK